MAQQTLTELPEAEATGDIARIYDEIRTYSAVPYVSSLQRHVATMPGCLEYAWGTCRPAFLDGTIPETAWRLAKTVPVAPFPALSAAALRLMGVDDAGIRAIRDICNTFTRVSPINLLFAACVEHLLDGHAPGGGTAVRANWTPPPMAAPQPPMTPLDELPEDQRDVLMQLAQDLGGAQFVPGLYRQLTPWPAYLAHAVTLIEPVLKDPAARESRTEIARTITAAAPEIVENLPPAPPELTPPTPAQAEAIRTAILSYRVTSPEMIVFGTLLRDALPV